MSKAGKTFYFASRWLAPEVRAHTATAYHFCRLIDDVADESQNPEVREELLSTFHQSISTLRPIDQITADTITLIKTFPEIQCPLIKLIESCKEDIPGKSIKDGRELIEYAHGVAGTVGLLMYPILGGRADVGREAANKLGIAMQCSNIARDVLKDLQDNREYLPIDWLDGHTVQSALESSQHESQSLHSKNGHRLVVNALKKVLEIADQHYEEGLAGLVYLNPRNRFAIRVAARCYQAIGNRVITAEHQLSSQRAVVPFIEKCLITFRQVPWLHCDYFKPIYESNVL